MPPMATFVVDEVIQVFKESWMLDHIYFVWWFRQRNLNDIHRKLGNASVGMPKTNAPFQARHSDTFLAGTTLKEKIQRVL